MKQHVHSKGLFAKFARLVSHATGHPIGFSIALLVIVAWAVSGPLFHFSDTWQLVINTSTTIVTFLMVFLIQNTQNRDNTALQLKVDELIRAVKGAHNALIDVEELSQEELEKLHAHFAVLAERARRKIHQGRMDTGCDPIELQFPDEKNRDVQ